MGGGEFAGQVAIVTGAGGSLGREYALILGRHGAKVVVNDFNRENAEKVAAEINSAGGEAIADSHSVLEGDKVVKTAIDKWGRIDVLINNAGFLRDISFQNMKPEQWAQVIDVHLNGTHAMTRAAWPYMRQQQYGRVLMISSVSGLYGSFGQANYSAAKMAVVGFAKTLAKEGLKRNIKVNALAPGAGSAMTMTVMPKELVEAWKPSYVAPFAAWMCHKDFPHTGCVFEAGGGFCGEVHWSRTQGLTLPLAQPFDVADVRASWSKVTDRAGEVEPEKQTGLSPQIAQVAKQLQAKL